jgi:hypothetical protein
MIRTATYILCSSRKPNLRSHSVIYCAYILISFVSLGRHGNTISGFTWSFLPSAGICLQILCWYSPVSIPCAWRVNIQLSELSHHPHMNVRTKTSYGMLYSPVCNSVQRSHLHRNDRTDGIGPFDPVGQAKQSQSQNLSRWLRTCVTY